MQIHAENTYSLAGFVFTVTMGQHYNVKPQRRIMVCHCPSNDNEPTHCQSYHCSCTITKIAVTATSAPPPIPPRLMTV